MPDELCDPQRAPGVAGSRLDPDGSEWSFAEDPSVADTVQGHSACKAEVVQAGFLVERGGLTQHDLLDDLLNGARQVHLSLGELRLGSSGGTFEQVGEGLACHGQA